jgi:hypothetical protein
LRAGLHLHDAALRGVASRNLRREWVRPAEHTGRSACSVVAELTTKNPNVFYELGLAHALEKPVVLVSSNEGDVPFDLKHIRVIYYDLTDPFWGQKLLDKIA